MFGKDPAEGAPPPEILKLLDTLLGELRRSHTVQIFQQTYAAVAGRLLNNPGIAKGEALARAKEAAAAAVAAHQEQFPEPEPLAPVVREPSN